MNKLVIFSCLILFCLNSVTSQELQGVTLKRFDGHPAGDTIPIYGIKEKADGEETYLIRNQNGGKYISSSKIRLLDDHLGYWQKIWFAEQASHIKSYGWQSDLRNALKEDYYEYASQIEINNLVFRDEFLEDYLMQLIYIIHPEALLKEVPARINILIIKTIQPEAFSFDNGTIVLTTGLIAKTNNEHDLVRILANQTAHIVMDHNLRNLSMEIRSQRSAEFWSAFATIASAVAMEFSNIQYGTNFQVGDVVLAGLSAVAISDVLVESAGANYNEEQSRQAMQLSYSFMERLDRDENFEYLPDKEYMINISSILSLTAWQEYNYNNYDQSMSYINRIFDLNIANEEDYLLKAKLTRTLSNNYESNLEALQLINTAMEMNDFNFVEALAEKGLILLRLGQVGEAKEVFVEYKTAVADMPDMPQGKNATWANRMMIKCDQLMQKR